MLTKGYSVPQDLSWIENYKLICQKKVSLISIGLRFSSAQVFVTLGKFCQLGSTNILGRQKFGLFHIEIKFVFKYDISSFWLVNSHYIL